MLSSQIVRVDEVIHVHTMLLSAPYGHMIGSTRFERSTTESDADFVDRLNPQIGEDCLLSPSDLLPGENAMPAQRKGFAGVSRNASDAFVNSWRANRWARRKVISKRAVCLSLL